MVDRWLNGPTVDFSLIRPVRAKQLDDDGRPPNMPDWRFLAWTDIPHDPPRDRLPE